MILEIPNFLNSQELKQLQQVGNSATFVDGRISNPHNKTKNNQQIDFNTEAYKESTKLMIQALARNETVRDFSMWTRIAPPLMCKYDPGMSYGMHADMSLINMSPQMPLRSDLSATIFLSDPETYDGGELVLHLESKKIPIKMRAGGLVIYPSTTLHEVAEVTRGQRLVAITFIESQISDERKRHMVYTLSELSALEGNNMKFENRNRLDMVRHNLIRLWS